MGRLSRPVPTGREVLRLSASGDVASLADRPPINLRARSACRGSVPEPVNRKARSVALFLLVVAACAPAKKGPSMDDELKGPGEERMLDPGETPEASGSA